MFSGGIKREHQAVFQYIYLSILISETIFGKGKPFKNDEKYLFHLKCSIRSQDI